MQEKVQGWVYAPGTVGTPYTICLHIYLFNHGLSHISISHYLCICCEPEKGTTCLWFFFLSQTLLQLDRSFIPIPSTVTHTAARERMRNMKCGQVLPVCAQGGNDCVCLHNKPVLLLKLQPEALPSPKIKGSS